MAAAEPSDVDSTISATSGKNNIAKSLRLRVSGFLNRLQHSIKNIPDTVPEAGDNDRLAIFCGNPKGFDDENLDLDGLWEEVLNPLLKSSLDWETEGNTNEIVCRGSKGVEGLLVFVKYFVEERRVSDSLLEGKLSNLMHFLETK